MIRSAYAVALSFIAFIAGIIVGAGGRPVAQHIQPAVVDYQQPEAPPNSRLECRPMPDGNGAWCRYVSTLNPVRF